MEQVTVNALFTLAATAVGAIASFAGGLFSQTLKNRRDDASERKRQVREALTHRLTDQLTAIRAFTEMVSKWETKPIAGKILNGERCADAERLADDVAIAHREAAALSVTVSAVFGGSTAWTR